MRKTGWIPWLLALFLQSSAGLQFTPVALQGSGDGECALIINGPGRSSQFDYNLNLLRGGNGFGYNGQHTCITYDAVNAAYLEARKRVQVAQPHGDYKPEQIATVGELLLDISVNLARTYGLSYEDIEKGLPLIDTSKTLIREVCPPYLSNVECRPGKYRRFDGLCTNLENPTWGATNTPFTRLIGPLYADGMTAPRISVTGNQLPLARVVSRTMHPDDGYHDHAGTVMVIAWGQFIDHDYTLTGTPLDPLNRNDPEECCKRPPHLKNPYCNEIPIPEDDYFYRLFNVRCIDFVRGFPAVRPGCRLGSRSQFNTLTGVLDANTVYGVTEKFARKLRSGYGGQLRMNPVFRDYGLKDLLPLKLDIPDEGCTRPNRSMYCFEAGEIRVNEQLVLTCMHTLMAREHNRVAEGLAQVNPHWDDETLFQEARRINIAEVQHITYNEFLPILLGKEVMEKFGLLLQKDGYWDGYDRTVNPNVIDAFAAAAYRFGHSLLPTAVERWSKAHKFIASKRLSDLIRRPYDLYRAGVLDEYFMGLMNQVAQAMDDSITQEVTNHLFKKVGAKFGMDLVSFNMQRGREFGLPGYMEFRKFCGLPGAETFDELFGSMPNDTIKRYSTIFEHPSDVDLWSGGVSERPLPGSMLGPTFACIIATQFSYSRRGDRFWYELPNQPSSFTPEQLHEIRKARLARVICDNTDLIDTIQLYPMVLPDHEINPRVPCRSGVLPSIDFTKWADPHSPIFQQNQHQPFTNNLVDANEVHPTIIKGSLFKEILNSNLYGKHPYESLFNQKTVKKIKILPPLILTPKKVVSLTRSKRNVEEPQNIPEKEESITSKPIIDQVTEQIIVTEISGTPQSGSNSNIPSNIKPLAITSSDFKNKTRVNPAGNIGINMEEIRDVDKLIRQKLAQISNPHLEYNKEEQKKQEIDEQETIVHTLLDDKNKQQTDSTQQDELLIFVPEKQEIEETTKTPEILSNFAQHFLEMVDSDPEKLVHNTKEIMDKNGNVKINGEDYSLPKVDLIEESEEMKEKNKYFDEIINKQMEENYRLAKELEYPDLDKEYETYRDYTANEYIHKRDDDFSMASKPFSIKIKGFNPYELGPSEEEHNFKDDVDVGTDKERQIDYTNHFQQDDKTFEQTRAALQNENEEKLPNLQEEEQQEEQQQEVEQQEQTEQAEEEDNQQYQEDEEASALIKKYAAMPRKRAQEIQKMKDELMKSNGETPSSSQKKYVVTPLNVDSKQSGSKTQKRNIFKEQDFMADLHKIRAQEMLKMKDELTKSNGETPSSSTKEYVVTPVNVDSKPSGSKTQKRNVFKEEDFMADLHKMIKNNEETPSSSKEKYVETPPVNVDSKPSGTSGSKTQDRNIFKEDFMADLHKMLVKRNSFSRYKNVENPDEYKNYWSLEYEFPNK